MNFSDFLNKVFRRGKSKVEKHQEPKFVEVPDPQLEKILDDVLKCRRGTDSIPGAFGGGCKGPFDPRPAMKPAQVKAMDAKRRVAV